jgi:hypothetical protein
MTLENVQRALQKLQDRQDILDVLSAYCRAVDRMDRALLLACYHPDAVHQTGLFAGTPEAFADWVFNLSGKAHFSSSHLIANHVCEIDGDTAHTETYFFSAVMGKSDLELSVAGGRYIDRLDRRNGKWAIAVRKVIKEWWGQPVDAGPQIVNRAAPATRDRNDPSYERPLSAPPISTVP